MILSKKDCWNNQLCVIPDCIPQLTTMSPAKAYTIEKLQSLTPLPISYKQTLMQTKILNSFNWLIFACLLIVNVAHAGPLSLQQVPDPLKPWVEWVSHGNEDKRCPFLYTDFNQHHCAWPQELTMALHATGGEFSQSWHVYEKSWLTLPGEERYWPVEVNINNKPALVISRNGLPAVQVDAGQYTLKGRFQWAALPKSLVIPDTTALLSVSLNKVPVDFPRVENNRLWLRFTEQKKVEDRFELQVFRHIDDTIPAQITFYLDMQVAGSAREIVLELPIDESFIPLRLQSHLPARLDSGNKLRLQVRPGRWVTQLTVRHSGPLTSLLMQKPNGIWVDQEVWVVNAQPALRIMNISGVTAIDSQQTSLPDMWRQLPAYRA